MSGSRVLLVEDDATLGWVLAEVLQRAGLSVAIATSAEQALHRLQTTAFDIVIADIGLAGDRSGVDLCDAIRSESRVPLVLISGIDADELADVAGECGANAWMQKPIDADRLVRIAKKFLGQNSPGESK